MLLNQQRGESNSDPRVRRTRQLLRSSLMELLKEKPFRSITVQEIADRATVNRVTFYAHFENKDALLEHTMAEMIRQHLRSRIPEGTPFSSEGIGLLTRTVCEFLAGMDRQCPPPHGQMETLMEKQIKVEVYELLRTWITEGAGGEEGRHPTPEQAAMISTWAIHGAAVQWTRNERAKPVEEYVQEVLPLVLASLQPLTTAVSS